MVSPTTVTFSVLALVLGDRPLRTGLFFYAGALAATLGIGILAAFVLGNAAASSSPSTPKTWVSVVDVVAAVLILTWVVRALRRPADPARLRSAVDRMGKLASSPAIAILGAGAALANPGAFIPIALKNISETDPSAVGYLVQWIFFAVVSLLPLLLAIVALIVARDWALRVLGAARGWLERNARIVAAVILVLLAVSLLRNGIAGLTD